MVFSSPPHLQIHLGTPQRVLPPLRSAPLPKTYTNVGQLSCDDTGEIRETHFCFGLEGEKSNSHSSYMSLWLRAVHSSAPALQTGESNPGGPARKGPSIRALLSACVTASFLHSSLWAQSGVWMRCYLRPWIQESLSGWVKHAHSLTVILLTPPTPPFPPLSLLLRVSYCRDESSLLTAEIRRCVN